MCCIWRLGVCWLTALSRCLGTLYDCILVCVVDLRFGLRVCELVVFAGLRLAGVLIYCTFMVVFELWFMWHYDFVCEGLLVWGFNLM